MKLSAYWQLMRFDKPIGIYLLWFPTAWTLWIANKGHPSLMLLFLFATGTVLMRAAGCVINDIADRHIDKHVTRTQNRPLTSGKVTLTEALSLLFILLALAFGILLMLPRQCFYLAFPAVLITFLYPFCKRFIHAPQAVLGLAFSMSIPMVVAASKQPFEAVYWVLMLINFFWIVAYDTMYAMSDRADDLVIGVKSTAIYFGEYDRAMIAGMQFLFHSLWVIVGLSFKWTATFYLFWGLAGGVLVYQQYLIKERLPQKCLEGFLSNVYYGGLMWLAIILGG